MANPFALTPSQSGPDHFKLSEILLRAEFAVARAKRHSIRHNSPVAKPDDAPSLVDAPEIVACER
jgi:hypothetical protein